MRIKQLNEERRRAERKQRHLQDDLRYALKKVASIDVNGSYEDVGSHPFRHQASVLIVCIGYPAYGRP